MLAEATERDSLSFGSRAVCSVLRPYFITAEQYEYVRRASTLVMMAIAALGRRLMSDARLRSELDLDSLEEEIIQYRIRLRLAGRERAARRVFERGRRFQFRRV